MIKSYTSNEEAAIRFLSTVHSIQVEDAPVFFNLLDYIYERTVRTSTGCREWAGSKTRDNYGRLRLGPTIYRVHRLVAFYIYADYDMQECLDLMTAFPKVLICHTCDNPPCCEPNHLVMADNKWNRQDASIKGRLGGPYTGRSKRSFTLPGLD